MTMRDLQSDILEVARQEKVAIKKKEALVVAVVESPTRGLDLAKKILYEICDNKTVLFLSGGETPRGLYEDLAKEEKLKIGAAAMVDERYGPRFHENSNELMIRETGLLDYLKTSEIPFYPILDEGIKIHPKGGVLGGKHFENRELLADRHERIILRLVFAGSNFAAIMGIGEDGHTAGIAPKREDFQTPVFMFNRFSFFPKDTPSLVGSFKDLKSMGEGGFGERITLSMGALGIMNFLIVLAFGSAKQNALKLMFKKGPVEEIPARFYTKPEIAPKTLLITDQKI